MQRISNKKSVGSSLNKACFPKMGVRFPDTEIACRCRSSEEGDPYFDGTRGWRNKQIWLQHSRQEMKQDLFLLFRCQGHFKYE